MRQGYLYTIVFTLVISAFFSALLAITNASYLPAIERSQELAVKRVVLDVLGVLPCDDTEVEAFFQENITKANIAGKEVFVYTEAGEVKGYAIPMGGPGLWGTIRGYVGVSADGSRLLGMGFTEHSETPGLGGRIDEPWYKEQFRGHPISAQAPITYGSSGGLDAITGATATSEAVLRILNNAIADVVGQLGRAQ